LPPEPILAVDLGATHTRAALVDPTGTVRGKRTAPTPRDGDPSAVLAPLFAMLDALVAEHRPAAIGVAAIGPLDTATGALLGRPPNLGDGWRDLPLGAALTDRYNLPTAVERDTNVSALGEHAFGAARGSEDFIYLTVSSGIGGAVVTRGRLLGGAHGLAGELGHIPVDLHGPPCGCGLNGCVEAIASGTAIAAAGRAAAQDGVWPDAPQTITAREVAAAARAGAAVPGEIMDRAYAAFAAATVGLVNAFDPGLIVVGGALAEAEGDRLLAPARAALGHALGASARDVAVVPAALGDDNGLLGAPALVALRAAG
jgi:glucokinase